MSAENTLLKVLVDKINNDTLVLPTLPDIVLKVRRTADDPNVSLNQMAEVISLDPSLSARMMRIANSAFLGRAIKAESMLQAVNRIGLDQIKNIATALALEQLYVSKNDVIKAYLEQVWKRNIAVMSHSIAVFHYFSKYHKGSKLDLDVMTLCALLHNIGVLPILTEAERSPKDYATPDFLNTAIQKLSGRIGLSIVRAWHLGSDFEQVVLGWRDLNLQSTQPNYTDFIRLGAVAAGYFKSHQGKVIETAMKKNIIRDIEVFEETEYLDALQLVKEAFD
ncbi:HDOD domain-containing protein [Alteromonas sp. a30]|uniref:HDOD domain-containing protein n=1 Tax=Alteromonas sp. a30 TaxID=2730917 RepID=UPI0022807C20|nr:HDOD domain-containing protein [Alteromonas sp. a30]MCY7296054.1 HDOD domain-containing protein [Alteromonas sp. a30]